MPSGTFECSNASIPPPFPVLPYLHTHDCLLKRPDRFMAANLEAVWFITHARVVNALALVPLCVARPMDLYNTGGAWAWASTRPVAQDATHTS